MMNISRVGFVALVIAAVTVPASAADYFVSPQLGSDGFNGRSATVGVGTIGPFASLKALQAISLRHGDRVLLRCGERFTGPVNLVLNSLDAGELRITSYGNCATEKKPVIDGRIAMKIAATGQLQEFAEPGKIEQVFAGDNALPRARFPANGYQIIPAGAPSSADSLGPYFASLPDHSLDGARLQARTQEWFIEERNIASGGGQLDLALRYPLRPKAGFYLTGKAWMIADQRAWSFDAKDKTLTLRAAPDELLTKVPSGNLLQVAGRGSFAVVGVDFDAAGGDAINVRLNGTVTINQVGIRRAIGNGVSIAGAAAAYVVSSTIDNVGLDAIFFAEANRVFVRRNRVTNVGLYGGPRPSLAAINAHRTNSATIEENVVENVAYHGIFFSGDARVRRNYVARSCLLLSDCSAIYTWRRGADDRRPHSDVIGNLIIAAGGDTTVKFGVNDWFAGIYLDEFSNAILVANNVIVAANQGIYLHNGFDMVARNNVVRALKTSIIDAPVDKTKYPTAKFVPNTVGPNSERVGDFTVAVVDSLGAPATLAFDALSGLQLRLRPRTAPVGGAVNCAPDNGLVANNLDPLNVALLPVFNCQ